MYMYVASLACAAAAQVLPDRDAHIRWDTDDLTVPLGLEGIHTYILDNNLRSLGGRSSVIK